MPVYDREAQRIVLRIVYDGPAEAGKTTNVQKLHGFFTSRRRGELHAPDAIEGRTLFFDWFDLDGGLIAGHSLRCQIVSVPGQQVLTRRRRMLLREADAVVFVCESTTQGIEAARPVYTGLRLLGPEGDAPALVLQANKQDLEGALAPEAVHERLGADAALPMVGASASDGTGVRETLVLAVRAAADRAQLAITSGAIDAIAGEATTAEQMLSRMLEDERARTARSRQYAERPADRTRSGTVALEESAEEEDAASVGLASGDAVRPHALVPPPRLALARGIAKDASERPPGPDIATAVAVAATPTGTWAASVERETTRGPALPPLPSSDVSSHAIWPPSVGRAVLRELDLSDARLREDLVARQHKEEGTGSTDVIILEARGHCLKTSERRRYDGVEEARAALVHLARRKTRLGDLLPPGTVLCLAGETNPEHGVWLWTVAPWLPTHRALMRASEEAGDEDGLGTVLERFAEVAVSSIRRTAELGIVLDIHPSNFAGTTEGTVYIDDDIGHGRRLPMVGYALLTRADEYEAFPDALERYVLALEQQLTDRLDGATARALGVVEAVRGVRTRTPAGESAKHRLVSLLERMR